MSSVLMLDLGDTLARGGAVLPHVPTALDSLALFISPDATPIALCLVSDFDMVSPPPTAAKVKPVFTRYLGLLDQLGLRRHFEPVHRRVTLSTHAGVRKPDRKLFALAIERLGVEATLAESIFITENAEHVAHCRQALGMRALLFGEDFDDWADGPLLVAKMLAVPVNVGPAITTWGQAHDMEGLSLVEAPAAGEPIRAQGVRWLPLEGPELGSLDGLHVRLPATVELTLGPDGRVASFREDPPSPDLMAESVHRVRGLFERGEVAEAGDAVALLATHRIERDEQGRRYLKRTRFTGAG